MVRDYEKKTEIGPDEHKNPNRQILRYVSKCFGAYMKKEKSKSHQKQPKRKLRAGYFDFNSGCVMAPLFSWSEL